MKINLPGYKSILDNVTYVKDIVVDSGDSNYIPAKSVIILAKFSEPSEDDVVDYIRGASLVVLNNKDAKDKSNLEGYLGKLPYNLVKGISLGERDYIDFIRINTVARSISGYDIPNKYLFIRYGLIARDYIEQNKGNIKSPEWYLSTILDDDSIVGMGERLQISLLLNENTLPRKDEIKVLLKHGVHSSKILELSVVNYNSKEVGNVVDAVYSGLLQRKNIDLLMDISDRVLEDLALRPIVELNDRLGDNDSDSIQEEHTIKFRATDDNKHGSN